MCTINCGELSLHVCYCDVCICNNYYDEYLVKTSGAYMLHWNNILDPIVGICPIIHK